MKLLLFIVVVWMVIFQSQSEQKKCFNAVEECHSTNYEEYVNCIRKRQKRSVDCDSNCDSDNCIDTCNECDCTSCSYSTCENSCQPCCSTCCNNYNICSNNHCCHKTCHAQCRSSSCRSSCRKNCYEMIKNIDETKAANITNSNNNRHNITTIIHLNNIINTTNIVDIPIVLNTTNQNNITLYESGYGNQNVSNGNQTCCVVISPRQCVPQKEPPYIRCFHYRSKQCGNYCTAPIVHKEQQKVCQTSFPGSAPVCTQSEIYIPQPQPRCTYQSTWPYVSCGIPRSASCTGCYSHYVNPYAQDFMSCPFSCYDEGFGIGPYYRQGPFYRPTYSHMPCFTCYGYEPPYGFGGPGGFNGYPGFGGFPTFGGYAGGYGGGLPSMGGYAGGYGGGLPSMGGYAYSPFAAGVGDPNLMPFGSWSPPVENSFQRTDNNTNSSWDPLISVDPSISNPMFPDPYRVTRELEIEVDYEPKSFADAEVKIRKPAKDDTRNEVTTTEKVKLA